MDKRKLQKLNQPETLVEHLKLIQSKKALHNMYVKFYRSIAKALLKKPKGNVIELGSGSGFLKDYIPGLVTSDVVKGEGIDKVFSATKIPYKDNTVAAFVMLDVLHHIQDPEKALKEMQRCLKKGGKIIMIEPYNTLWSRFVYKNFHHERFDEHGTWKIPGSGRLTNSNMALPWILFNRDKKQFESKFPHLKVTAISLHTPFGYLATGGLSYPQLLPTPLHSLLLKVESHLPHFILSTTAMFATIVLEKP